MRSLNEILGLTKTQTKHDLKLYQRVRLNDNQSQFKVGRTGTIVRFDEYNIPHVKLDIYPELQFWFHPTALDIIDGE